MLAHTVLLSVGAFAAVVAAAPALESRATSYVFHYNTGNVPACSLFYSTMIVAHLHALKVACSGINIPSNGIYAAVQDVRSVRNEGPPLILFVPRVGKYCRRGLW